VIVKFKDHFSRQAREYAKFRPNYPTELFAFIVANAPNDELALDCATGNGQAANLLVPVCLSSSHIAYGSIRMEPVFMILGQSAATAASMAIDGGVAVQDVSYDKLRARLVADGQVLEYTPAATQK